MIKGSPKRHCLVEFLDTIGAKHQGTHYGAGEWSIVSNPQSKDLPNSSKKLELHIDMPYLAKPQQVCKFTRHLFFAWCRVEITGYCKQPSDSSSKIYGVALHSWHRLKTSTDTGLIHVALQ